MALLSGGKRGHFMAARDVVTAAAIQLMMMADKGRDEGVLVATVAVSVNATDGEVMKRSLIKHVSLRTDQPFPCFPFVLLWTSKIYQIPLRILFGCFFLFLGQFQYERCAVPMLPGYRCRPRHSA